MALTSLTMSETKALKLMQATKLGSLRKGFYQILKQNIGNGVDRSTDKNNKFSFEPLEFFIQRLPNFRLALLSDYEQAVEAKLKDIKVKKKREDLANILKNNNLETKLKMGALLNGLCLAVDEKGIIGIVTASNDIFGNTLDSIPIVGSIEPNKLWGYLLTIKDAGDANGVGKELEFSLHTKVDGKFLNNVDSSKVLLYPFDEIIVGLKLLEDLLGSGKVLRILSLKGNRVVEEFFTRNRKLLMKYSDNDKFFKDAIINPIIEPFSMFVYEPKLGVSSLKTIQQRIDIVNINKIEVLTSEKDINIKKPDRFEVLEREKLQTCISNALREMYETDPDKEKAFIDNLEGVKELFGEDINTVYSRPYLLNDLYEDKDLAFLRNLVTQLNATTAYMQMTAMMSENFHDISVRDLSKEEFENLLKDGAYRITYQMMNTQKLTVRYVTKDKKLLELCYGRDYLKYGSDFDLGYAVGADSDLLTSTPEKICEKYYQLPETAAYLKTFLETKGASTGGAKGSAREFLSGISFRLGINEDSNGKTSTVRAYKLFSPIVTSRDGRKKIDAFTEFIDFTRVKKIIKLR